MSPLAVRTLALTVLAALASFAGAVPALAQTLGQGADNDLPWWRVIGSLIFCLVLAGAAAFVLRDRVPMLRGLRPLLERRRPGRLRLIESTRLAQQVDVCLLRCDDNDLLIAVSPQGAVLLSTQPAPAEAADNEP
jgi:flagellar biogenesis protein FliO